VEHHCRRPTWHALSVRLWQLGWLVLWSRLVPLVFALLFLAPLPHGLVLLLLPLLLVGVGILLAVGHGLLREWRTKPCLLIQRW
jgi:hypothetical protein